MLKKIKNDFFAGILVILPLVITAAVFTFLVDKINEKILNPMLEILGVSFFNPYWNYLAKGIGFIILILSIIIIGWAARLIFLRRFFGFWEKLLLRVPMMGKIYATIKEISQAFLGQRKQIFEQVVLVEYPRKGIYSLGFVTASGSREIQEKTKADIVYVFLPTTPNPTNGFFLVVPKEEIIGLEISVADAFKLIVSGGTFRPYEK
ncbi:MAG: DUF502 domain-containing protein [Candidatus Omnitrophica bacterium]|nr:DUF502 domain-containing protein [Candidatus Omnitrophota bacterium]